MSIKITETDRDTLLVNGKELAKVGESWQLLIPGDPLTTQEQIALLNYLNGGEAKPVTLTPGIIEEVLAERRRQDEKWGEQNHQPVEWLMILAEEVGEANKAALEMYFDHYYDAYRGYREELIQVAAVAIQMIESLDRGKWKDKLV